MKNTLFSIANIQDIAAAVQNEAPEFSPIDGLEGWSLLSYTAEKANIDAVILKCTAGAVENPLHSGGDVNWLGYALKGAITLILGDSKGRQTSSHPVKEGDLFLFEPETFHGWIPSDGSAELLFVKQS